MDGPRIGSLCTGYGGLDLAVIDVLGGHVAWHAQYDPADKKQWAAKILEHRWPDVPNHGDITRADWFDAEPVDVITAGFPCQPVSHAGLQKGTADDRWIWPAVAQCVRLLRPRLLVLENVAALVVRGLPDVVTDLARIGYVGTWTCLRASDVGAPHQRNRAFILAWPADAPGTGLEDRRQGRPPRDHAAAPHPGGQAVHVRPGHSPREPAGQRRGRPHHDPDTAASDTTGDGRHQGRTEPARILRGSDAALGSGTPAPDADLVLPGNDLELQDGRNALRQRLWDDAPGRGSAAADAPGLGAGEPADEALAVAGSRHARTVSGGRGVLPAAGFDFGLYAATGARWEHILGRAAPPPVDARGRLAPVFVEWMMGAPEGWVTDVPKIPRNAQLKALGNGVVRQQGAEGVRRLAARMPR